MRLSIVAAATESRRSDRQGSFIGATRICLPARANSEIIVNFGDVWGGVEFCTRFAPDLQPTDSCRSGGLI
jgi:hypothetical protein